MIRRKRARAGWLPTRGTPGWPESTYAETAWGKSQGAAARWAIAGAVLGTLIALVVFAPASWLAQGLASATQQRLVLADARGSVWSGSAVPVLTGGPDSRDASALPGRLEWAIAWRGTGFELRLQHACCLNGIVTLRVQPGLGRTRVTLPPPSGQTVGRWPSAWLGGLGTPWNTLQLGGTLRLGSPGLVLESAQGRWRMSGSAQIELAGASSRLSTLDTLGSYRLTISGAEGGAGVANMALDTIDGALLLSGSGIWGPAGVRFRGEAQAAQANEAALSNLLNIIGRRNGARSVISIG